MNTPVESNLDELAAGTTIVDYGDMLYLKAHFPHLYCAAADSSSPGPYSMATIPGDADLSFEEQMQIIKKA